MINTNEFTKLVDAYIAAKMNGSEYDLSIATNNLNFFFDELHDTVKYLCDSIDALRVAPAIPQKPTNVRWTT